MQNDHLTQQADGLLKGVPRDPKQPHYSEATIERKVRSAHQRERSMRASPWPTAEPKTYLQRRDLLSALKASRLTQRQFEVVTARLRGDSWNEIGRAYGHTKQGSMKIFHQAARKISHSFRAGPYADLHSVYIEEVNRHGAKRRR